MTHLPYQIHEQPVQSATLALVVLSEDETVERDMRRLLPDPDLSLLVSRIPSGQDLTTTTLSAMKGALTHSAQLFPKAANMDCVGYACTSGTSVIGSQAVSDLIKQGCRADHVTDPFSALIAACRHLGIARLGLLSPYVDDVSAGLRDRLQDADITTPIFGSFGEQREANVVRITRQSIIEASRNLAAMGKFDALFMSCTNLRTMDVIAPLEAELDLPVLSSNQVLAWHMAKLANLTVRHTDYGRLFSSSSQ